MRSIKILALCAASAALMPLQAQQLEFGGSVQNHDLMWAPDFAQLSQTHVFGTARVMGMGGAFTSLGADLSSMSLNPAGLGMYRHNEISITPLVPVSHASTEGVPSWVGNNKARFALANLGAALNVFESSTSSLTSLTLGIGMNRIADFNTRYSFSSESVYNPQDGLLMPTIADVFAQQLNTAGIKPDAGNHVYVDNFSPNVWPSILGYDAYMIGYGSTGWVPERIGHNASVLHSYEVVNTGSINEFTLSMGGNINNIVYFGATLGLQSVHKKTGVTYQEEYGYFDTDGLAQDAAGTALSEQLIQSNLYQQVVVDGSGVNFKLGVVVRPVAGLRLGMAFHTPTYYSLDRSYRADIFSDIRENATGAIARSGNNSSTSNDEGRNNWEFTSPARLMFGVSYTFGSFAIVSVDYERDWYNGIRVKNMPDGSEFTQNGHVYSAEGLKDEFKNRFQATNAIRAGVEFKPLPILALRVGGGYTGSMLQDRNYYVNSAYASMPATYESTYFSVGAGVTLSRTTTIDLSYQHLTDKQTQYQLFFSGNPATNQFETWSGHYDTKLTRHYIAMTLGFRF